METGNCKECGMWICTPLDALDALVSSLRAMQGLLNEDLHNSPENLIQLIALLLDRATVSIDADMAEGRAIAKERAEGGAK